MTDFYQYRWYRDLIHLKIWVHIYQRQICRTVKRFFRR